MIFGSDEYILELDQLIFVGGNGHFVLGNSNQCCVFDGEMTEPGKKILRE